MGGSAVIDPAGPGAVHAVLGPTNTGKTHVAIQRMLGHRTGMMGLPLRLLAREVYDRVVREKGPDQVALVTGEEKRVPAGTRYWICTTESMPLDRPVAFVAVDEIQLAADPARGHVFTDRILHARGVAETWFLGSDTMTHVLEALVPGIQVRAQPRLSRLGYAGARKITSLPPRSAVVAFSADRVYELAERLKARHGGAAVVLGALSPRARNAQVELYQDGAVQHMVATDAIGMGLNMDVHHVALAGARKYDGRTRRDLRADELAQIAGRAGRWRRDGTFGETGGLEPLDPEVVAAIEAHAFPPVRRIQWRSRDLAFDDPDRLLASLEVSPRHDLLVPMHHADDHRALRRLLEEPQVRDRVGRDAAKVALLWDVCGVPDFGNVLPEHHAQLLQQILVHLLDHGGRLPEGWLDRQVDRLDRPEGDIGTLMARIAGIRIWTYVANRADWLDDAAAWQARTREVEDRLSDALHGQLTARFVDRRHTVLVRGATLEGQLTPELRADGEIEAAGVRLGSLRGLSVRLDPGTVASTPVRKAVRALVAPLVASRLEEVIDAPDGAFAVDEAGRVLWDEAPLAQLQAAADWRRPRLKMLRMDWIDGPDRGRLAGRLEAWLLGWTAWLIHPLDPEAARAPAARGLLHVVAQGMGAVPNRAVRDVLEGLSRGARRWLVSEGLVLGERWVLHPAVTARARERAVLWRVAHGDAPDLGEDLGITPRAARWPRDMAEALGFDRVAGHMVRADVLEVLLAEGHDGAVRWGLDTGLAKRIRDACAPAPASSGRRRRRRGPRRR